MHPHLRQLQSAAEHVRVEVERLRDTLTEAQLTWRPDDATWSIADVFEHVRRLDKAYARRLTDALRQAGPDGEAPFRPGLFARLFIAAVSPGFRWRMSAPQGVRPDPVPEGAGRDTLDRFLLQHAEVRQLLCEAEGRDLNTGRFPSPLNARLKLSVGEALTGVVRHQERHLQQALRLTERPDFPRSESA